LIEEGCRQQTRVYTKQIKTALPTRKDELKDLPNQPIKEKPGKHTLNQHYKRPIRPKQRRIS
jgi:hypothetical protein